MKSKNTPGGFRVWTAAALIVCLTCPAFVVSQAAVPPKKKVLLIHSYHAEYPWVAAITRGVRKAFEGKDAEMEIFYMDTKRYTSDEFKAAAGERARQKIDEWKPDVVIACDDNAQIFVTQRYVGKKPPFVFCGVNAEAHDYGFPASNATGILERPNYVESVRLLKETCPYVKRVAVLSDKDPTSVGALTFMQREAVPLQVTSYRLTDDFNVWKQMVLDANKEVDALLIYMYHTLKENAGMGVEESLPPRAVMRWTVEHCTIPTVGFFDFAVEDGALLGVVESGEEHGFEAAGMALAILEGRDIRTLSVKKAVKGMSMVNLRTAKGLSIEIPANILSAIEKKVE